MPKIDLIGANEIRTTLLYRQLIAETLGTAILVIVAAGGGVSIDPSSSQADITGPLSTGLCLSTVIWVSGHVSGAHINPSVTVAMLVTRKIPIVRGFGYIVAQCLGATIGAAILWGTTPNDNRGTLGVTLITPGISVWQGMGVEIIATFLLVITIFASCDQARLDHGGSPALMIGLVLAAICPWAQKYTGASLNPARSFGPSILTGLWKNHWVYWIGPIIGGVLAGGMYELFFAQKRLSKEHSSTQHMDEVGKESCEMVNSGNSNKFLQVKL